MKTNTSSLFEVKAIREIGFLKGHGVPGPNGLLPSIFKDSSEVLISKRTKPLMSAWTKKDILKNSCESVIGPFYNKGNISSVEIHRRISSVSVASQLLAGIILRQASITRKRCISESRFPFQSLLY